MKRMIVLGALLVLGALSIAAAAQQAQARQVIDVQKVSDNYYVLTSSTPGNDATFSGGDVRAALEQIRWHTEGNGHRPCLELCRCHREARRGFANKERDRVFELRALNGQVSGLRLSRVQLSLGLRDVLVGCDARIVADLSELERFLIRNNRFIEESLLLVKRADLKIIDGQFGVDSQADILEITEGGLSFERTCPYRVANPSP